MPKHLLIVGAGGHAKEVAQIARRIDPDRGVWHTLSYVAVSAAEKGRSRPYGKIDFCDNDILSNDMTADVIIGLGDCEERWRVALRYLERKGLSFPNLIDPSVALAAEFVTLGKGNVVHQRVVLTVDIVIGDFNLFNKGCIVGHDVRVGSFNDIQPAASVHGYSRLGDHCVVGAGARVLPHVSVADRTTLGAGGVLLRTVLTPGQTYAGVPARPL